MNIRILSVMLLTCVSGSILSVPSQPPTKVPYSCSWRSPEGAFVAQNREPVNAANATEALTACQELIKKNGYKAIPGTIAVKKIELMA